MMVSCCLEVERELLVPLSPLTTLAEKQHFLKSSLLPLVNTTLFLYAFTTISLGLGLGSGVDKTERERESERAHSSGDIPMFRIWGEEPAEEIEKEQPLRKERDYSIQEAK